jgi:hypothetical protein
LSLFYLLLNLHSDEIQTPASALLSPSFRFPWIPPSPPKLSSPIHRTSAPMHPPQLAAALLPLLLAPLPSMAMLHCENILINGYKFNLEKLKGPHSVVTSKYDSVTHTHHNTTYTLDVCQPLKKSSKSKSNEECPNGTRGMLDSPYEWQCLHCSCRA